MEFCGSVFDPLHQPDTFQKALAQLQADHLDGDGPTLITGRAVGSKVATGTVRVMADLSEIDKVQPGDVLVADTTVTPLLWFPSGVRPVRLVPMKFPATTLLSARSESPRTLSVM